MRSLLIASTAALALAVAACGNNPSGEEAAEANLEANTTEDIAANMNMDGNASADATTPGSPLAAADFASTVAASDMFEIESGKLAAAQGSTEEIKSFGRQLQADHQKSTSNLKAAASRASPPITPSPSLTPEQQADLDALRGASGAEFDRLFHEQQVKAHQKALGVLQSYAQGGDSEPLKTFADTAAAAVRMHLDKINGMQH